MTITVKCLLLVGLIQYSACRYVDLSYPFNAETIYWPGSGTFELQVLTRGMQSDYGGYWLEVNKFSAPEHGGTHIDALAHFSQGGLRIGDMPVNVFIANAVVMDISAKAEQDPTAQLEVDDVLQWENEHGPIMDGSILLVYTGWSKRWPDKKRYMGNDQDDTTDFHYPGVSNITSQWLVDNRKLKAVGIDTLGPDCGQCKGYWVHRILLPAGVYIIENVANLGELPPTGAKIYVFPMKIEEGSGAPTRIIAEIFDDNNGVVNHGGYFTLLVALLILLYLTF